MTASYYYKVPSSFDDNQKLQAHFQTAEADYKRLKAIEKFYELAAEHDRVLLIVSTVGVLGDGTGIGYWVEIRTLGEQVVLWGGDSVMGEKVKCVLFKTKCL